MAGDGFTAETARLVFWVIWGVGLGAWALAVYRMQHFGSSAKERSNTYEDDRPEQRGDVLEGSTEIALSAGEAKARLASFFAMNAMMSASGMSIVDSEPDQLRIVRRQAALRSDVHTQWGFDGVIFEFVPKGTSATEVRYRMETARLGRVMRTVGYVFVFLGGAALLVVAHVMLGYVVNHPRPAVRYQVFQTLQVAHFLWPPFVMSYVYARSRRGLSQFLENVIQGLPYHASVPRDTGAS